MIYRSQERPLFILLLTLLCLTRIVESYHEWLIEIAGPRSLAIEFAKQNGLIFVDEMHGMPYHYIFHSNTAMPFGKGNSRIKREAFVSKIIPQTELIRKKRSAYMNWNDPYFSQMWYLHRSFRDPTTYDMNVLEAWELGYSGKGVVVTIMDDGVDYTHDDLKNNYDKNASFDINGRDKDPMPDMKNSMNHHGTRCAGQVAASGNNTNCIVGVAYEASIGGIRMLDGKITDRVEAEALMFNVEYIDIYSGSWGPDDSGENHEGPGQLASYAFNTAISKGRRGLGAIFIWASGNGGNSGDSCAFDGYASNIYTISISSVSESNSRPWYQERCTSTLATTYSSGDTGQKQVLSIDLLNRCTSTHTGTSASAPLAAGFVALLLQANPDLTWRDVQYIIVLTSITKPFRDGLFTTNGAGRNYSMFYGFGLMDAGKMVRLGKLWHRLPEQHKCKSSKNLIFKKLEGKFDIQIPFRFDGCIKENDSESSLYNSGETGEPVRFIEHLQLFLDLDYSYRGILRIQLISPSGTIAEIMPTRIHDAHSGEAGFQKIPLTTVQFWGEALSGLWTIRIDNQNACREIEEGYVSTHMNVNCNKILSNVNKQYGTLNATWLIAHGTEDFPIRLKKPPIQGKFAPPKNWFSKFEKYVINDDENSSGNTKFKCNPECDPYGGCDESNNCLGGCRNYVLRNGTCVNKCPSGTSGILILPHIELQNKLVKGKLCENCHKVCKTCFRPNSEMDCLSCHDSEYLIPLLNNQEISKNLQHANTTSHFKIPEFMGTCSQTCPPNYYKHTESFRCLKCVKNCQTCTGPGYANCQECRAGFIKGLFECTDQIELKCSQGTQYKNGHCISCSEIKVKNEMVEQEDSITTSEKPNEFENNNMVIEKEEELPCAVDFCLPDNKCAWCSSSNNEDVYMFNGKCLKNTCPKGTFVHKRLRNSWSFQIDLERNSDLQLSVTEKGSRVWLCAPCQPGCISCQPRKVDRLSQGEIEFQSQCQECDINLELILDEGASLNQPKCLSKCPYGHYNESVLIAKNSLIKDECMALCSSECSTCNLSQEHCLTCKDVNHSLVPNNKPYMHYNCVNKDSCPTGYYSHFFNNQHICTQCPPGCRGCSSSQKCDSCHNGFILHKNGACLISTFCGTSQFYDVDKNICTSCHSSCETCNGPSMKDCKSCSRFGTKNDSCLWISENIGNVLIDNETDVDQISQMSGVCMKCCSLEYLLSKEPPKDCLFCVANQNTCISYDFMVKNISKIHDSEYSPDNIDIPDPKEEDESDNEDRIWSPWQWITAKASRLVLVALCLGLGLSSLIFVAFHFYMLRKCCTCPKNLHSLLYLGNLSRSPSSKDQNNQNSEKDNTLLSKLSAYLSSCFFCFRRGIVKREDFSDNRNIKHDDEANHPLRQNFSFTNQNDRDKSMQAHNFMNKRPFSYHEKEFNHDRLLSHLTNGDHSNSQPLPNIKQKVNVLQNFHQKSTVSPQTTPTSGSSYSSNNEHRKSSECFIDRRSRNLSSKSKDCNVNMKMSHHPHESLSGISKEIPKNLISPLSFKESKSVKADDKTKRSQSSHQKHPAKALRSKASIGKPKNCDKKPTHV